jgi:hypothetical protein
MRSSRVCQVPDQESTRSVGTEGTGQSVSNLEHGASECCVFTLKLYKGDFEVGIYDSNLLSFA